MWRITNLETNEVLYFRTVEEWQNYTDYHNWHSYTIVFENEEQIQSRFDRL